MTKLFLVSLTACAIFLPGTSLVACATDNGDAVHGPQFGPPPERPDGANDGPLLRDEGGPPPNLDGGNDGDAPTASCTSGTIAVLAGDDATLTGAAKEIWINVPRTRPDG